jgi:hypothetical protein
LEAEQSLLKTYFTFGPKWTMIAKSFPDRTANNMKNKAKQLVRRMQKLYKIELPGKDLPARIRTPAGGPAPTAALTATLNIQQRSPFDQRNEGSLF